MHLPATANTVPAPGSPVTLAVILYPVIIHLALYFNKHWIAIAWLCALLAVLAGYNLYRHERLRFILSVGLLLVVSSVWLIFQSNWVLFMPPVVLFALLAWWFGGSLRPGREALITRIALVMTDNQLPQAEYNYTRRVTWIWAVFFVVMCIESILLAVFAPLMVWSTMTNFVNYILVALVFVLEFAIRKMILKQNRFTSFFRFIRVMLQKRNEIRAKLS